MQKLLPLAIVMGFAALPAAAESVNWSGTGPNGGTAAGSADCSAADGSVSCTRSRTYTSPVGRTFTAESEAVRSRDGGIRTTTRTGPNGRSGTVTVERSR